MPIDPFLPIPRLLEVAHVAHRLGFTQEYVRDLIHAGKLPAILFGRRWRIDPRDLQVFIDTQRAAGSVDRRTVGDRRSHARANGADRRQPDAQDPGDPHGADASRAHQGPNGAEA